MLDPTMKRFDRFYLILISPLFELRVVTSVSRCAAREKNPSNRKDKNKTPISIAIYPGESILFEIKSYAMNFRIVPTIMQIFIRPQF